MSDSELAITLLAEFEVRRDGEPIGPTANMIKPRILLAALAVNANHVMSKESLIDRLWDDPPPTARNLVEKYISLWRKSLDAARLETVGRGYRLNLKAEECDLLQARQLRTTARAAMLAGNTALAAGFLGTAMRLWDPAFDDIQTALSSLDRSLLSELWLTILQDWAEATLNAREDGRALIDPLIAAMRKNPLRERLAELLIWALCGQDRQEDATRCYEQVRHRLVEELGQDPGESLKNMYLRVLRRDPDLFPAASSERRVDNLAARHNRFVGRVDDLVAVARLFARSSSPGETNAVALWGLVGAGKSALAFEFAHQHREEYDCIWWINADTRPSAAAGLEALAARLGCALPAEREDYLGQLWRRLRSMRQTLLIFDDCTAAAGIADLLPPSGVANVLITSLNPQWSRLAQTHAVGTLSAPESADLLCGRIGHADLTTVTALTDALGRLPLAISQAAAYIGETGMRPERYLPLFLSRRAELLERGVPDDHDKTIGTMWRLARAELSRHHPAAVQLLEMCSVLAPESIPLELLRAAPAGLPSELSATVRDDLALEDTIGFARRYSLITRDADRLQMHCLVQSVIASSVRADSRELWLTRAAEALVALAPDSIHSRTTWPMWEQLVPHVRDVARGYLGGTPGASFIAVVQQASHYLASRAAIVDALALMQCAQQLVEQTCVDPHDVSIGRGLTELGSILEQAGYFRDAIEAYEHALTILRHDADQEDAWVARALSGLTNVLTCHYGVTLWKPSELAEAERRFVHALTVMESVWGPAHPVVARALCGLGQVRQDRGDLAGGQESLERALVILQSSFGPDHPDVGHAWDRLAYLLAMRGDSERSRDCYRRSGAILSEAYGADNVYVAWSHSNLAMLLVSIGDVDEALTEQQLAHVVFSTKPPTDPAVHISAWRLAKIYLAASRPDQAVALLDPARRSAGEILGSDHADVIGMQQDLDAARSALDHAHTAHSPVR